MKQSLKLITVLASIGLLCFVSCKKKKVTPEPAITTSTTPTTTPPPTTYTPPTTVTADKTNLNPLFAALRATPQTINVTAGAYQVVYGAKGTKLTFYPNSFKDAAGNTIASGTITLQLVEMYKPGQMIAERATTTSSGDLLMSAGQIRISATKGGATVYARTYGVGFKASAASSQDMALYYGNTANEDSVTTWGAPATALGMIVGGTVVDTLVDTTTIPDTSSSGSGWGGSGYPYYQFDSCTNFNWINSDYGWGSSAPTTTVSASISDTGFNAGNTQVFFVFPAINSVGNASGPYTSTMPIKFKMPNLPAGTAMKVIAIAKKKDGSYYYSEQNGITVSTDLVIPVSMTSQSISYIRSKLAAL